MRPAWMTAAPPPGVGQSLNGHEIRNTGNGPRLIGKAGSLVHLENNFLDTPVRSIGAGGTVPNHQQCRFCAAAGHFMWECPQLRELFRVGKVDRSGHPM